MNAVDQIIERCQATIREFEAFMEQHRPLIERAREYAGRNDPNYHWWLLSLTDEAAGLLDRYYRDQVKVQAAERTLATWGAEKQA